MKVAEWGNSPAIRLPAIASNGTRQMSGKQPLLDWNIITCIFSEDLQSRRMFGGLMICIPFAR